MLAERPPEGQSQTDKPRAPPADVVSYSAAMDACARAGRWDEAVAVLGLLQQDRRLDVGGLGLTTLHSGGRGSKYCMLTTEHLDVCATVFNRCDEAALRMRATELLEAMRSRCDERCTDVARRSATS